MTEPEIIVEMRKALDVLKSKWQEAEGAWAVVDFMSAAGDASHWMLQVVRAEQLSNPYMDRRADGEPINGTKARSRRAKC